MQRSVPQPRLHAARFHEVCRRISRQIESGELSPGDRLPSERWLGESFGVSRTTIRRAITELVTSGALEMRGRAVFVADNPESERQNTLLSLTQIARTRGLTPSAQVLLANVRPATLDEAEELQTAPGADLFELRRVRLLDGSAIGLDHDRVPLRLLPNAMDIDFTRASFFASLAAAGQVPVLARLQIEARAATTEESAHLDLEPGVPVLVATEKTLDARGDTLSLGWTVYRSDRYRFLATFRRTATAG